MKTMGLLLAPALALLLLAAHFHRAGWWPLTLACAGLVALLALRRAWVAAVAQAALWLGALEWLWTTALLVQQRQALGQPWLRLAAILGAVALFTAAAALALRSAHLRGWYRRPVDARERA